MDDFGNIAYVLMAIGWFLFNAYKKAQKNKEKRPSQQTSQRPFAEETQPQPEPTRSFEDLILEQLGGKVEEEETVQAEPIPVYKNEEKFLNIDRTHSHLPDNYQMGQDEMKSHRVTRNIKKVEREVEQPESLYDSLMPSGFDLKQAVILNAILERPYK